MENILKWPLRRMQQAIMNKTVSSEEVVTAFIERIDKVNPAINALVQLRREEAICEARKSDSDLSKGIVNGPLHGIPFTVKDCLDTQGIVTTCGIDMRRDFIPKEDATVVARLKGAGGILLGKTNLPWFCSTYETNNSIYGRTNNPYDISRTPGGSSGGEAAIIAAGGSPLGIGSDSGGSIRIPCHYCGITGLKPTAGRIPKTGHFPPPMGPVQAQIGPMAKYIDDLVLTLPIISGPDYADPAAIMWNYQELSETELKGLKVACFTDNNGTYPSTTDTISVVKSVVSRLSDFGMHIVYDQPECLRQSSEIMAAMFRVRTREFIESIMQEFIQPKDMDYEALIQYADIWLDRAKKLVYQESMTSAEYYFWINNLDAYRSRMLKYIAEYDVLICPVAGKSAMPHGFTQTEERHAYANTLAFSLTGWPVAVVRAGTSTEGLPIGVQVVARPYRDDVALAMARLIEVEFGGWMPPVL